MNALASNHNGDNSGKKTRFQSVSKKGKNPSIQQTLLEWMRDNKLLKIEGENSFNIYQYPEAQKDFQTVNFTLSGVAGNYGLLRGLISLGRQKNLILENINEKRLFVLKFCQKYESEAKAYLEKIFSILENENQFKQVLRKVISNQEKQVLEDKLLQTGLNRK